MPRPIPRSSTAANPSTRPAEEFSEEDLVALTMAIVTINGWNRLALPFREVPGTYKASVAA